MENKVENKVNMVQNIISWGVMLFAACALIYFGYSYFFSSSILKSDHDFFELTVSNKYEFIENEKAQDEYIMAKFDKNRSIYIFAQAYNGDEFEDYKEATEEYYQSQVDRQEELEIKNISSLEEIKIADYIAYTYSYTYIDTLDKECYIKMYLIGSEQYYYQLSIESLIEDKDKYKEDFDTIAKSFKEIAEESS